MRPRAVRLAATLAASLALVAGASLAAPLPSPAQPAYPTPDPDPFYHAPDNLAALAPGDVIRHRRVDTTMYAGSTGWQVAFRSTSSTGAPIVGVTTVMLPAGVANPPLLSYQAIVNSLGTQCSPSRGLFNLELSDSPGMLVPLAKGWAVNIPDHTGPYGAYGAARLSGLITLDSVRAAQKVADLGLADAPVVIGGYSGGGMASAWAAALAPTYAPDLKIAGVVEGGVPADLPQMVDLVGNGPHPGFGLAFAGAMGLEREYGEGFPVSSQLNPTGQWLRDFTADACRRFLLFHGMFRSIDQVAANTSMLHQPAARQVLADNSLRNFEGVPTAPILIIHGKLDPLTPYDAMDEVAARYCAAGVPVQFLRYEIAEHLLPAMLALPEAVAYVEGRFRGDPAPTNC